MKDIPSVTVFPKRTHVQLLKRDAPGATASRIADNMLAMIALQLPKKCICCGAPADEVRHD